MIILVRHGETEGNARRVMQVAATPLSEVGLAQAERVAQRVAREWSIAAVLSSDMPRAHMTAQAIARRTGAPLETSPLLHERNFGTLRGTAYAALTVNPFAPDYEPPEGESFPVFYARVERAFALVRERQRAHAGVLVVVTHGGVCSALALRHLQLAEGAAVPALFGNTSVTLIDAVPPHRVQLLNCIAHLTDAAPPDGGAPV